MLHRHSGRPFHFAKGGLACEHVSLAALAERFGTPLYVYGWSAIETRLHAMHAAATRALGGGNYTICFAVKANPNLEILRRLAGLGTGFDIVSGGELERVRRAAPQAVGRAVFSGVGKSIAEMDAALAAGILLFNVESAAELALLSARAGTLGKTAQFAVRVNPNVGARTHPYIATGRTRHKFGVPIGQARALYAQARNLPGMRAAGISVHIGSQIRESKPFADAVGQAAKLAAQLAKDGEDIRYLDAGGGLGVDYNPRRPYEPLQAAKRYMAAVAQAWHGPQVHWLFEPGRFLAAHAGCLLCRVLLTKTSGRRHFIVVDAGMNDLMRPALYGARHAIVPVQPRRGATALCAIVGPVCETADVFASAIKMPSLRPGDLLAILDTGAYGMGLASNYNARPRAAEVVVDRDNVTLARRRETLDDLVRLELQ